MKRVDITGQRFGRLLAVRRIDGPGYRYRWECVCDCGRTSLVELNNLRSGNTTSCGCVRLERLRAVVTKHGMVRRRIYRCWQNMRERCGNPANSAWANYGGRGIAVCERWQSFDIFYADMGDCDEGMTIERIDVDGNYEPSNCRWATRAEQSRNKRTNRMIEIDGIRATLKDWSERSDIPYWTLHARLRRHWPASRLLEVRSGLR